MKAVEVVSRQQQQEFLAFPARLMAQDTAYIRPLDKDVEAVFDSSKNILFREGTCTRFLFINQGKTVGRVAVFINPRYENDFPVGGFGFFDVINDQTTANFIFDFCRKWLEGKGMKGMDGPINFGERDKFWGLLAEGFTPPPYGMNYNPPYYRHLMQNYGFQVYFNQLCYSRAIGAEVSQIFMLMHQRHSANPDLKAIHLDKSQLRKFAQDFTHIYNAAWAAHGEGKQLTEAKGQAMFQEMKPVIDEKLCWFVYHGEEPVAMWINLPDINRWMAPLKGKFGLWEKIKFFWQKTTVANPKMVGMVFGVVPRWQKTGLDAFMIVEGTRYIRENTAYTETEMQWIGDFNPKMMRIAERLGAKVTRKLTTYRFIFDENIPFERHPDV